MKDGQDILLKQVKHVPEMRMSLISMGLLDDEGYSTSFGRGGWKISKGALVVAKGPKTRTLYTLKTLIGKLDLAAVTKEENSADLWHKRLGHMSEKGLKILVDKKLLRFRVLFLLRSLLTNKASDIYVCGPITHRSTRNFEKM